MFVYNTYYNNKPVNVWECENDAIEFAIAIINGDVPEFDYNPDTDEVGFDSEIGGYEVIEPSEVDEYQSALDNNENNNDDDDEN